MRAKKNEAMDTMTKLRVFVSSVQKELEDERVIVQNLLNTDPFLAAHCAPVLYEFEPASPDKALEGCLKTLDTCEAYLLIIVVQYGTPLGELSTTHAEYRRAKERKLPVLAFIKGDRNLKREEGTDLLLKELDADGPKYKRFGNVIELQKEVRAALVKLLKDQFGVAPSTDENEIAQQTIEATSTFESQPMTRLSWKDLDHAILRRLIATAEARNPEAISPADLLAGASLRGLVWHDPTSGEHYATAAGIVLLAKDPSAIFPQCRILADAYRATEPDGQLSVAFALHADISGKLSGGRITLNYLGAEGKTAVSRLESPAVYERDWDCRCTNEIPQQNRAFRPSATTCVREPFCILTRRSAGKGPFHVARLLHGGPPSHQRSSSLRFGIV
jgi:predicted HTH transcriptional regulator